MPGGLEVAAPDYSGIEPVYPEIVSTSEQIQEPDTRALLLSRAFLAPNEHARRESIHDIIFQKHTGVLLLGLRRQKVLSKVMNRNQLTDMKTAGFRPSDNMHITVLNSANADLVLDAFEGQRKQLAKVREEAYRMDWRWRLVGQPFSFRGPRSCAVKILNYVDCPGVEDFYNLLEEELPGLKLERSPLHLTLMYQRTKKRVSSAGGVALNSPARSLKPTHLRLVATLQTEVNEVE